MARYIDADKMVPKDSAYTTFPHDLAGCDDNDLVRWINEQPTADVVPIAEVEQLKRNLEQCENGYRQTMHLLQCKLTNARAEVAREIFEEIAKATFSKIPDKIMLISNERDYSDGVIIGKREAFFEMANIIAELKKKYTEEKKNED